MTTKYAEEVGDILYVVLEDGPTNVIAVPEIEGCKGCAFDVSDDYSLLLSKNCKGTNCGVHAVIFVPYLEVEPTPVPDLSSIPGLDPDPLIAEYEKMDRIKTRISLLKTCKDLGAIILVKNRNFWDEYLNTNWSTYCSYKLQDFDMQPPDVERKIRHALTMDQVESLLEED